mmetsp:Transcript_2512/g.6566  ORF Transcript_2512/g.6566 Transcript_2512/m.6566 type:complete len:215 (-) Transcript_2512:192-836(-)
MALSCGSPRLAAAVAPRLSCSCGASTRQRTRARRNGRVGRPGSLPPRPSLRRRPRCRAPAVPVPVPAVPVPPHSQHRRRAAGRMARRRRGRAVSRHTLGGELSPRLPPRRVSAPTIVCCTSRTTSFCACARRGAAARAPCASLRACFPSPHKWRPCAPCAHTCHRGCRSSQDAALADLRRDRRAVRAGRGWQPGVCADCRRRAVRLCAAGQPDA